MSEKQTRRHFSPEDKVAIVKRHLLEGTPVSKLCDEFAINPTLFYQWQRQLFENAHLAFDNGRKSRAVEDAKDQKIERLGTYNEINTDGTWSYYYDGVGNMVEKINLSSSVTWNYAYDMDYQLTSAVETNAGGTVLQSGSYSYDVFNNLVAETITVSGVASTSKFAYDGSQIYADLNSTGSVQTLYVTGMSDGSGQLYARIQSGTLYWIVQDREGSVREIINSSGSSILDAITYTDDGGIQSQTGSTYLGNYGYTGLRYDSLTTYWVAVNRWYDPATDQWLEVDPDGYAGGLSDLRDYVGNDWTNEADLGGFQPGAFSEMMKNIPRSPFGYGYGVGTKEIFNTFTPTTIIRLTDDASENYKKLQETLDSFNSIKPTTIMEKAQKGFVPNINLIIYDPDTQKVLTLTRPILASMINKLNTMGANKEAPQPKQLDSSALPKLSNTGELPRNNIVEAAELAGAKQITKVVAFGANQLITALQKKNIIPQSFEFKVDMNLIQEIEKNSSKYGLRSSISGSYKPNSNFEVKGNLNFQPNSHGGLGIGGSLNFIIYW